MSGAGRLAIGLAGSFALLETVLSVIFAGFAYDNPQSPRWAEWAAMVGVASLPLYCFWFLFRRLATTLFALATVFVYSYWAEGFIKDCEKNHAGLAARVFAVFNPLFVPFFTLMLVSVLLMSVSTRWSKQ